MLKGANVAAVAALVGTLAACGPRVDPTPLDDYDLFAYDLPAVREMAAQGPAFNDGLRVEYLKYADAENAEYDFSDYGHFARKAVASAQGDLVLPDQIALRELPEEAAPELEAARARLMSALDATGRKKAPLQAARAQTAFDCWLQEQEENHQPDDIAACRAAFEEAITAVEDALGEAIDNVYIVFFAFDRAAISPVAMATISDAAEDFANGEATKIVLAGHADRAGSEAYNLPLSRSRAEAVADELARLGVDSSALDVTFFGESEPLIPTEDGEREPRNRRVEITFE